MARSIHTTRRDLRRVETSDYAVAERREAELDRVRARLEQKRCIKAAIRHERRIGRLHAASSADSVPIVITETGKHVHHVASIDDVRHVLRRLPPGVVDGLARIELQLGTASEVQRNRENGTWDGPDPFSPRPGFEGFPGLYSGNVLGTYLPSRAVVRVNAYVFHAATPLREIWEPLVRARALGTLVHEIGHHYDHTMRIRRGRWIAEGEERREIYAEGRQHAWLRSAVLPYLRVAYPTEIERVEQWVARFGGVALPFELLVDDPRGTKKGGYVDLNVALWSMEQALENLMSGVVKRRPLPACRIQFARDLHYREMYDEALTTLDTVIDRDPGNREALTLRADIFVHLERAADALVIAQDVVALHPRHRDAWEVIVDALYDLGRWSDLVDAAGRLLLLRGAHDRCGRRRVLLKRATGAMRSGDLEAARADLDAFAADFPSVGYRRWYERLRAELAELARAGTAPTGEQVPVE